ncbi:MAG TPA: helicase-related protein [Dehalococcoidia bacterium]|nr:helicase-related protein [Dehalococcoidia bacterium]
MNLARFIETFQETITRAVLRTYPPLYTARNRHQWGFDLRRLRRRPLGAQGDAIRAVALSLQRHRGTNLVGEMGTGKTTIAAAAAHLAGSRRALVLCPPHLVRKWQREILATVPGAAAAIVRTITDLQRLPLLGGQPLFVVLSREQAKLSYRWSPAVVERLAVAGRRLLRGEDGEPVRRLCCPACFAPALDNEGLPLEREQLERKKHRCQACRGPLWQADRSGPRRFPLADYIARRMPGFFDLLIVDEQHEYKARGSAQGLAAGALAEACRRVLTLTGTLMGGYSSTLFYLLWRFSPAVRDEFAYKDEQRWVARYGIVERITRKADDDAYEDGRVSRRRGYRTRVVEKPGVSPAVLFHLIGNTAFLRLADVAAGLPEYREEVRLVAMEAGHGGQEASQSAYYHRLAGKLHAAVVQALAQGSKRLLAAYLQSLLAYPDACTKGETVVDPHTDEVLAAVPPLPEDRLCPKEQALLDLVRRERLDGRRVLVYITHTASRDISPRLEAFLRAAGFRVATLKSDTVSADRREEWVERRVKEGLDVLVVHPRLVQTGLDLVDFPTIVWYEVEYSVYTMRQASRRSWRIGQRLPVRVVYFAYRGTLQAQALALVAKKLQASLAVEGELVEEGLASFGDDGDDLLMALARSLTERVEANEDSLEGLFAGVRQKEQEVEAALQPDDMTPEEPQPEPEPARFLLPERRDSGLSALLGLPLVRAAVRLTPPPNGDQPQEPPAADEPAVEKRAAATVFGSESRGEDPPPPEGQQLRLF